MPEEIFVPPKTTKPSSAPRIETATPPKEVLERSFSLEGAPSFADSDDVTKVSVVDNRSGKEKELKVEPKGDEHEKSTEKAKETVQDKGQKKEESKVDEKGGKKEEVSPILKPPAKVDEKKEEKKEEQVSHQIKVPKKEDKRDYTGFTEEETGLLKQMSNEAFEYASKLIKKSKEVVQPNKQDQWFQHPQAYLLSPEYGQGLQQIQLTKSIANYWKQQLLLCQDGKPIRDLVGFDKNTGNPVQGQTDIAPTKELEERLRSLMIKAETQAQGFEEQLSGIQHTYNQRIQSDLAAINTERAKRFEWVANPEVLKYTITTQNGEKTVEDIRNDVVNLFPPYLRDNPGTQVAADLMVALVIRDIEVNQLRNGKQVAQTKEKESELVEPNSTVKPSPETKPVFGKVKEFSTAGMPSMNS